MSSVQSGGALDRDRKMTVKEHEQREFMSVVQGLERCNELDVGDLKLMSVKGHA